MYMDAQNRPSNAQSIVGSGTIVSTDSIDLLSPLADPGRGNGELRGFATLTAALVGATSVQAQLISSANSDLSSPTVLASGPVVAVANAAAGTKLFDQRLPGTSQRYLGFQYVLVGTASAGAVTAGIVAGTDRNSGNIPMNTGL